MSTTAFSMTQVAYRAAFGTRMSFFRRFKTDDRGDAANAPDSEKVLLDAPVGSAATNPDPGIPSERSRPGPSKVAVPGPDSTTGSVRASRRAPSVVLQSTHRAVCTSTSFAMKQRTSAAPRSESHVLLASCGFHGVGVALSIEVAWSADTEETKINRHQTSCRRLRISGLPGLATTACDMPWNSGRSRSPASSASSPHVPRPDSC
jgi:hypothetical protein